MHIRLTIGHHLLATLAHGDTQPDSGSELGRTVIWLPIWAHQLRRAELDHHLAMEPFWSSKALAIAVGLAFARASGGLSVSH